MAQVEGETEAGTFPIATMEFLENWDCVLMERLLCYIHNYYLIPWGIANLCCYDACVVGRKRIKIETCSVRSVHVKKLFLMLGFRPPWNGRLQLNGGARTTSSATPGSGKTVLYEIAIYYIFSLAHEPGKRSAIIIPAPSIYHPPRLVALGVSTYPIHKFGAVAYQ